MPSIEAIERSGVRPSIVRHGGIFASDLTVEELLREIGPYLHMAGLILSFSASRLQAGNLMRLARDHGGAATLVPPATPRAYCNLSAYIGVRV